MKKNLSLLLLLPLLFAMTWWNKCHDPSFHNVEFQLSLFTLIKRLFSSFLHMCACSVMLSSFSHVWLSATPWTAARQALLFMGFSREEYWSELPCTAPGDLPDPGIELKFPASPALQADSLPMTHQVSAVPLHFLPLEQYHLHIWDYWYFNNLEISGNLDSRLWLIQPSHGVLCIC